MNLSRPRIESIDVLRGVTILVMLFVNDIAGVPGTPAWMKHISPHLADGLTFVDVVFPAFLFIVGMSIPFAMTRRLDQHESMWSIWCHILLRVASLLIIGVFMVNHPAGGDSAAVDPNVWSLLMYGGVLLVWNRWPQALDSRWRRALRGLGVLVLVVAALLYRGDGEVRSTIELRTSWWGILGLIGWAYLVGCTAFSLFRRDLGAMMGFMALLYCLHFAAAAGYFEGYWLAAYVNIGSHLGSHGAVTVSGVILGMILQPNSRVASEKGRIRWTLIYGVGLAVAAILLHALRDLDQMFIYNKILATPPWCLLSSALTVWVWVAIYWVVDVRGWKKWTVAIEPAGRNSLFAYILAPILYAAFPLIAQVLGGFNLHARLGDSFAVGFWRSLLFAFGLTWLTGALRRVGVQPRL